MRRRTADEPPGVSEASSGLTVAPEALVSEVEPMANSSRLVLPTGTAPAARRRSTTVAVYGGRQPSRIFDEQLVMFFDRDGQRPEPPGFAPGPRPSDPGPSRAEAATAAAMTAAVVNCVGILVEEGRQKFDAVQGEGVGGDLERDDKSQLAELVLRAALRRRFLG